MDEKILKKLKTTCPFPLLIYKTSVKYNEVRKASGISYILLNLIQKESESSEKISNILLKFGIPTNLHYIFGKEIANLISTNILSSRFDQSDFSKTNYFKQFTISDVELTPKGEKMFKDGFIPTGAEKIKVKDIYYDPVTRRYDIESKLSYMPLGKSFLGDNFMDNVDVDISGIEDYINANKTKIGLKNEERVASFEHEEPQKMHTRKEKGMTIIIKSSGVEFKFDTTDENVFFNKYYNSKLMTQGILAKNKYKFINENNDMIEIPTMKIKELRNIKNIHIPDDAKKEASQPCDFFFNKNVLDINGIETAIKLDVNNSTELLNYVNSNAAFGLLDKNGIRYYCPLNISMPCEQLNDTFEMQLLIEKTAEGDDLKNLLLKLYDIYKEEVFNTEIAKAILFIIELLKDSILFKNYLDNQLSKYNIFDDKIELLLKMNSSFKSNTNWKEYFKKVGFDLITNSIKEIRLDNMIYKNNVLTPLKKELKIDDQEYINMFAEPILNEDNDLVYQALETAKFEPIHILSVVNVIENYIDKILKNEENLSVTNMSDNFKIVSKNLWKINNMLGIESYSEYTLKEDFNIDDFFNSYTSLKRAFKEILKYSKFAQEKYNILDKYLKIYEPIHELLTIEREASLHPERITKKYIDDHILRGRFKNAICELSVKLQYDLKKILNIDYNMPTFELINILKNKKLIDDKKYSSLHNLRKIRNGLQHPEKNQIQYTKSDVEEWKNIVFEIGGNK